MLTYKNIVENLDVGIAIVRNGKYLSNINIAFRDFLSLKYDVPDIKSLLTLIDSDTISLDKFKIFINYTGVQNKVFRLQSLNFKLLNNYFIISIFILTSPKGLSPGAVGTLAILSITASPFSTSPKTV